MQVRQTYETAVDVDNERSVADQFERKWGAKFIKLRRLAPVDFAIVRDGTVVGWAEVKCRKHEMGKYPTLILSADKAMSIMGRVEHSGLPCFLCVRFSDGLAFVAMKDEYLSRISIKGRNDRGDDDDMEPCIEVPIADFRRVQLGR